MRRALTKAAALMLAAMIVAGCSCCSKKPHITAIAQPASQQTAQQFSNERYVWESWIFSTNIVPDKVVK